MMKENWKRKRKEQRKRVRKKGERYTEKDEYEIQERCNIIEGTTI